MDRFALFIFAIALVGCGGRNQQPAAPGPAEAEKPTDGVGGETGRGDPCAEATPKGSPAGDDPCAAGDGAGVPSAATGVDWSGWKGWTKVTDAPYQSAGHSKVMVDIYVHPDYVEPYRELAGEMPRGFAEVKVHYKGEDAASGVDRLTAMAKMGVGYDPDNGNWYYAALSPDGTQAMVQGKLESCINCHSSATNDYLFGPPD